MKHSSKYPDKAPPLSALLPVRRGRGYALTLLQQRFVLEYLACLDAHEAARRLSAMCSKPATEGVEAKPVVYRSRDFLRVPAVKAAFREALAERAQALGITADKVLLETAAVAFGCLPDALEEIPGSDGLMRLKSGKKARRLIAEYEEKPGKDGVGIRVKGFDKVAGLKLLSQQLGMIDNKAPKQAAPAVTVNVTNMPPPENPIDRMAAIMSGLADIGALPMQCVNKQLEAGKAGGE